MRERGGGGRGGGEADTMEQGKERIRAEGRWKCGVW